jgi:hypothetical protein
MVAAKSKKASRKTPVQKVEKKIKKVEKPSKKGNNKVTKKKAQVIHNTFCILAKKVAIVEE